VKKESNFESFFLEFCKKNEELEILADFGILKIVEIKYLSIMYSFIFLCGVFFVFQILVWIKSERWKKPAVFTERFRRNFEKCGNYWSKLRVFFVFYPKI